MAPLMKLILFLDIRPGRACEAFDPSSPSCSTSVPEGNVTMRIAGNVGRRRGVGCCAGPSTVPRLGRSSHRTCQGEPAYRLTRGISTDTRYVTHRRLSQLDPAVIAATKDVEGIDRGDRLALLACWQLQGSPPCPPRTIAMLQEPCLPKPKLKIGSNQWRISWLTAGRGFLVFDLDDKLTRHHQRPSVHCIFCRTGCQRYPLGVSLAPWMERFQSLLAPRRTCTSLGDPTVDKVRRDTTWRVPSSKLGRLAPWQLPPFWAWA